MGRQAGERTHDTVWSTVQADTAEQKPQRRAFVLTVVLGRSIAHERKIFLTSPSASKKATRYSFLIELDAVVCLILLHLMAASPTEPTQQIACIERCR